MISLVYTSVASSPFSDGDLAELLMNSRANNRRRDLTGFLMHEQGRFVQVLEGPEDVVDERYAIIAADPRHADVEVVQRETIAERRFPQWTMGYRTSVDTAAEDIPGYRRVTGAADDGTGVPDLQTAVHSMLAYLSSSEPTPA
jgi:hypothetical protein